MIEQKVSRLLAKNVYLLTFTHLILKDAPLEQQQQQHQQQHLTAPYFSKT